MWGWGLHEYRQRGLGGGGKYHVNVLLVHKRERRRGLSCHGKYQLGRVHLIETHQNALFLFFTPCGILQFKG